MHQIAQQPSSIMRVNRVKSENEIGIFFFFSSERRCGDTAHFYPFSFCVFMNILRKKKKFSSVIFNLGKFLNINPHDKKSKRRESWKRERKQKGHQIK
jgi:hypothetical protein